MVNNLLKSGLNIGSPLFSSWTKNYWRRRKQTQIFIKSEWTKYQTKNKKVLQLDLANYAVKKAQNNLYNWQNA